MLFEPLDGGTRPHLLHEAVYNLDAGEVAFVHRAVECLAGESFAVQTAVGSAVEETSDFVFKLADALDRLVDKRPGELLVRQPLATLDRVHEMALDRVAQQQGNVVAALHHPGAARLSQQSLGRNRHLKTWIGVMGMESRKQACAAGAENENIGL